MCDVYACFDYAMIGSRGITRRDLRFFVDVYADGGWGCGYFGCIICDVGSLDSSG